MTKKEYSANEVSKMLGLNLNTIIYNIKKGSIKARIEKKLRQNYYYISHEEVERLKKTLSKKEHN